jgi:hypothetical protein
METFCRLDQRAQAVHYITNTLKSWARNSTTLGTFCTSESLPVCQNGPVSLSHEIPLDTYVRTLLETKHASSICKIEANKMHYFSTLF